MRVLPSKASRPAPRSARGAAEAYPRCAERFPELDALDWYSFHCAGCGQETFVGRQAEQSPADFAEMCSWLYGDPPLCSYCLGRDSL